MKAHHPYATIFQPFQESLRHFKIKTCAFSTNKIEYLGFFILLGRLEVANRSSDAIRDLKRPTTQVELRYFIATCIVFRRFVPNAAGFVVPLAARLRKEQSKDLGQLDDEELTALRSLQ